MSISEMIARKTRGNAPVRRTDAERTLYSLQQQVNRLFDEFFWGGELTPFAELERSLLATFSPRVDVSETEKEMIVSAELPGMDEKDVVVELSDDNVSIRGERKTVHDEKGRNWHSAEQSYGAFQRIIPLPYKAEGNKAVAKFKNGLLTVTLPKAEEETRKRKMIEVKGE